MFQGLQWCEILNTIICLFWRCKDQKVHILVLKMYKLKGKGCQKIATQVKYTYLKILLKHGIVFILRCFPLLQMTYMLMHILSDLRNFFMSLYLLKNSFVKFVKNCTLFSYRGCPISLCYFYSWRIYSLLFVFYQNLTQKTSTEQLWQVCNRQ